MAQVGQQRQFCFRTTLKYFRTKSGEEREGNNPWGDVGPPAESLIASLSQKVRRNSDYSSGSEPSEVKDDTEVPHWEPMGLDQFNSSGGSYVDLFRSQLPLLEDWQYWTPNLLKFVSIQAYVQDVRTDQYDDTITCTKPLYLTPDTVTGELYCSKGQPLAGPYNPLHLNRLEVNYVLCSCSQSPISPMSLDIALFSPKFEHNYALAIAADSSSHRVDVKFKPIRNGQKGIKPELPCIHCTAIKTADPSTTGAYNISIKANAHTYWLYLDVTGSPRVTVRAFREDSAGEKPAKFNFLAALFP